MFNTIGVIGLGVMGSKVKKAAVSNYTRGLTDQLVQKNEDQQLYPYNEIEGFVQS